MTETDGRSPAARPASLARRCAAFAAVLTASAIVARPALRELVAHALADASASHVVLVPFVSAALVWMNRAAVFASTRTWLPGLAGPVAGAGLGVAAVQGWLPGGPAAALSWSTAALVAAWAGGFALVFGRDAASRALFPLLFLAFTVPVPAPALDAFVQILKSGSADTVGALFTLTGTPYFRSGFVFELPTVAIEIADECSGIRSSLALTLTSLLAGHLFLDSPWKKAALVLAVLPITIVKNAIRIVTLSLLAVHVDPSFLVGQLHHEGGVVFFLLALALLFPVLSLLRRPALAVVPLRRIFASASR